MRAVRGGHYTWVRIMHHGALGALLLGGHRLRLAAEALEGGAVRDLRPRASVGAVRAAGWHRSSLARVCKRPPCATHHERAAGVAAPLALHAPAVDVLIALRDGVGVVPACAAQACCSRRERQSRGAPAARAAHARRCGAGAHRSTSWPPSAAIAAAARRARRRRASSALRLVPRVDGHRHTRRHLAAPQTPSQRQSRRRRGGSAGGQAG